MASSLNCFGGLFGAARPDSYVSASSSAAQRLSAEMRLEQQHGFACEAAFRTPWRWFAAWKQGSSTAQRKHNQKIHAVYEDLTLASPDGSSLAWMRAVSSRCTLTSMPDACRLQSDGGGAADPLMSSSSNCHTSTSHAPSDWAEQMQALTEQVAHGQAREAQLMTENARLMAEGDDLQRQVHSLQRKVDEAQANEDSWWESVRQLSIQAEQHELVVCGRLQAARDEAQAQVRHLQAVVEDLEARKGQVEEWCRQLQAESQEQEDALRCCQAARQAAEEKAAECQSYVKDKVVPALEQVGAERDELFVAKQALEKELNLAHTAIRMLHQQLHPAVSSVHEGQISAEERHGAYEDRHSQSGNCSTVLCSGQ